MGSLTFLRVSNREDADPTACDEYPQFDRDVWPLIMERRDRVGSVYLWKNRYFSAGSWSARLFATGVVMEGVLSDLGPLGVLDRKISMDIYSYCVGGHLNVFFELSDPWFQQQLRHLWRLPGLVSQERSDLALEEDDYENLVRAATHRAEKTTWSAFSGEGQILFVLGSPDQVRSLADSGVDRAGGGLRSAGLAPRTATTD